MTAVSKKFYNLFWNNEICRQIFGLHKELLLERKEIPIGNEKRTIYLQRIVLSNSPKKQIDCDIIANRVSNQIVDINEGLKTKGDKYFDEKKFKSLIDTHFGKAIEIIEKKINSGTISQIRLSFEFLNSITSEEKFIKFLKRYCLIPSNIDSFKQFEEILNKKVSSIITNDNILDFIDSVDKISEYYTTELYNNLLESEKFYTDVFYEIESYKDRLSFFDLLYEAKIIESGIYKTIYECHNCDENIFKAFATIKAKPSKLTIKCPICNKETFYLSPYKINDEIYSHIIDKDGTIKFAIKYLLEEYDFTIQENIQIPPDTELDLVAFSNDKGSMIIELKMFKNNISEQAYKSNLNSAFSKALKAKEKLYIVNNDLKNLPTVIVTNYNDNELLKIVREANKVKMNQFKIKLLSLNDFKNMIENPV